jgi:hypothetical protein
MKKNSFFEECFLKIKEKNIRRLFDFFVISFIFLFVRYQFKLTGFKEWGDESETIVVAKMMASGMRLYSEVYEPHAPLIYLPSVLLQNFLDLNLGVQGHRFIVIIFQWFGLVAIYFSPLLKDKVTSKIYILLASTFIVIFLPRFYGHTYIFQTFAGLSLLIVLVQYTLPSLIDVKLLNKYCVALGNFILGCVPFFGISYIPITFLFFLASIRKKYLKVSAISFVFGLLVCSAYLHEFGSWKGFYALHIYLNTKIMPNYYAHFYPNNISEILLNIARYSTSNLAGILSIFFLFLLFLNIYLKDKLFYWENILNFRFGLVFVGIISLLSRGSGVHGLAYYYLILGVPAFFIYLRPIAFEYSKLFLTAIFLLIIISTIKMSLLLPRDMDNFKEHKITKSTEFSSIVKIMTIPTDRIIAFSWHPYEYIVSNRLPATASPSYFPWVKYYDEHPLEDIVFDTCQKFIVSRPKLVLIDNKNIRELFPWHTYSGCIEDGLKKDYVIIKEHIYLRKDLYLEYVNLTKQK